jgi:hypothetical protein
MLERRGLTGKKSRVSPEIRAIFGVDNARFAAILGLDRLSSEGKIVMKKIQTLLSAAFCGLILLAFVSAAGAQDTKQGVATVVRVKGLASYTLGGNDVWHPLVAGKVLNPGAAIKTGPDATVDVVLGKAVEMPQAHPVPDRVTLAPDSEVRGMVGYKPSVQQNIIRLSGDTTVKIDILTVSDTGVDTVSDTELDLQNGRIFYSVKKLSAESKYLVKIPNGIAGVRGSQGFISADGKCGAFEHPLWLSVIGADGKPVTVTVGEGQQYDPATGATSSMPPEILDLLNQISKASRTCYLVECSYSYNQNQWCHISPTVGYQPLKYNF